MGRTQGAGISRTVRVQTVAGPTKARKTQYGLLAQQEERECAQQRYQHNIQGLGTESLQALAEIHASASAKSDNPPDAMNNDSQDVWEDVPGPEDLVTHTARDIIDSRQFPYHRRYCDGLFNAFDVYLSILRIIDKQVAKQLRCDGANWRVLNACPPCSNMLEDEPPLQFSRMFVLDGNNSLKRVGLPGDRQVGDLRTFEESDYYLSNEFVDRFANEVKKHQSGSLNNADVDMEASYNDGTPSAPNDNAGDPTDGANTINTPCAENWKAAASDTNKKMWGIFDESGIFAKNVIVFAASTLSMVTLTIFNVPNNIEGMGLEDLETLERVFSASNQLAPVTHYMSKHRRHVFIDLFFHQWDDEKYENLGTMLLNNYNQALQIIKKDGPELESAKEQFNVQEGDLEKWRLDERHYFSSLGKEPEEHLLKIAYVERLRKLREAERTYEKAIDKLQKLVIQRLFELQKLNLSYTAYKMRSHIAKSLQTCCQAIRNAVATYNKAALALDPPKPTLDWSRVSHYNFLEDFALIRDTNRDISDRSWAKLVIRQLMKKDQKLKQQLQEAEASGFPIYGAVKDFVTRRRRVNAEILKRIYQIYSLPGFSGVPRPGVKKGSMKVDILAQTDKTNEVVGIARNLDKIDIPEVEDDDDDEVDALNGIVNFLGDLSVST
ncbi:hypothetical protein C0992_007383 [Termitomyces sp. T32_za158]|nr:hypothetical protein C0992_007383 [Termitomyces sp. T32_za158]